MIRQRRRGTKQEVAAPGPAPSTPFSPEFVLELLWLPDIAAEHRQQILDRLAQTETFDLRQLRHFLALTERQLAPSPVHVSFGSADLVKCEALGLTIYADRDDAAISPSIIGGDPYEPHVIAALKRYCTPGMVVVDAGANIGFHTVVMSEAVGPTGRVVAIEPNSENCRLILLNVAANDARNVELLPVALDAQRGWAYFSTHLGSNGGLIPSGADALLDGRGLVVPTFTLDSLVEDHVDLIKIDLEGAEGRALAGATRILSSDRPVVVTEFSAEMLNRISGVAASDYLSIFLDLGYDAFRLDRASTEAVPIGDPEEFLAEWGDPHRIEDLLMLPD